MIILDPPGAYAVILVFSHFSYYWCLIDNCGFLSFWRFFDAWQPMFSFSGSSFVSFKTSRSVLDSNMFLRHWGQYSSLVSSWTHHLTRTATLALRYRTVL